MQTAAAVVDTAEMISAPDPETVLEIDDRATGLRAIIAVHSTALGPALGGLRLRSYPGGLPEAREDVLRLASTMTLKASAAGLHLGGGKAVIVDDGDRRRHPDRLRVFADHLNTLGGTYVTAEDIGTTTADMDALATHSRFVVGRSREHGGAGDPSDATARTVLDAVGAGLEAVHGSPDPAGRRVTVIGLGKVGGRVATALVNGGAIVAAFDLDADRAAGFGAATGAQILPDAATALALEADVLIPCAAGELIGPADVSALRCRVVAGAANNPLTGRDVAEQLAARGILYVPDFLANCGGLIAVAAEWDRRCGDGAPPDGPPLDVAIARADERLRDTLAEAAATGRLALDVAEERARARIAEAG